MNGSAFWSWPELEGEVFLDPHRHARATRQAGGVSVTAVGSRLLHAVGDRAGDVALLRVGRARAALDQDVETRVLQEVLPESNRSLSIGEAEVEAALELVALVVVERNRYP